MQTLLFTLLTPSEIIAIKAMTEVRNTAIGNLTVFELKEIGDTLQIGEANDVLFRLLIESGEIAA